MLEAGANFQISSLKIRRTITQPKIRSCNNFERKIIKEKKLKLRPILFQTLSLCTNSLKRNCKKRKNSLNRLRSSNSSWLLQKWIRRRSIHNIWALNKDDQTKVIGDKLSIHHQQTKYRQQRKLRIGWNTIKKYNRTKELSKKNKGIKKNKESWNKRISLNLWVKSYASKISRCQILKLKQNKSWSDISTQWNIWRSWQRENFLKYMPEYFKDPSCFRQQLHRTTQTNRKSAKTGKSWRKRL